MNCSEKFLMVSAYLYIKIVLIRFYISITDISIAPYSCYLAGTANNYFTASSKTLNARLKMHVSAPGFNSLGSLLSSYSFRFGFQFSERLPKFLAYIIEAIF